MTDSKLETLQTLAQDVVATTRANTTSAEKIFRPKSRPSEPRPAIPSLPPKTKLDLSQPTVNVPDVPEFTIPAMLSANAESVSIIHPGDLTQGV